MPTLERILVPLDGSPLASRILGPVLRLAEHTKAEVRAIRVLDGFEADQATLRGEDPRALASAELGRALEPLRKRGVPVAYDTYVGDAAARILEDSATYGASLIAMATHGRSGVERWVRGSVAERVLRASTVPLLLMNPHTMGAVLPVRRILVPLDRSGLAAAALPLAQDFARIHDGAEIVLLHVIEPGLDELAAPARRPSGEALDLLAPFVKQLGDTRVRTVVRHGSPALEILETAEREEVDLIAMSTHGRSGVSRWAFGSTAEDVVRHATTPLLVRRA